MGILQQKPEVIAVGNLNIDLIGKVERLPARDEKLLLEELVRRPGGGAANFAAACSKLGLKSGFIGCVGKDEFGEEMLADLVGRGVDISRIRVVDAPTGIVFALSTLDSEHFLLAYRGANSFLKPENIDEDYIEGARVIHASSVSPEIALAVGEKAKKTRYSSLFGFGG